jgi:hypothetical protein
MLIAGDDAALLFSSTRRTPGLRDDQVLENIAQEFERFAFVHISRFGELFPARSR